MTLQEAREAAIDVSSRNGDVVQHISARIVYDHSDKYVVDQKGYYISDWCCGSTVESYCGSLKIR